MTVTPGQYNACLEAWMHCETLLQRIGHFGSSLSRKVSAIVDECALICMGTFHAMSSRSQNVRHLAVLCVGICEECADVCEDIEGDEAFMECARTCRHCSSALTEIAFTNWQ